MSWLDALPELPPLGTPWPEVVRLPPRPPRRMPTFWAMACYWKDRGVFLVDLNDPHCFGCGTVPGLFAGIPSARWTMAKSVLEKAHLVDRCGGGLDGPQNVVPLCWRCHRAMPPFGPGMGRAAIEWVRSGGRLDPDGLPKPDGQLADCSRHGAGHAVADEPQCVRRIAERDEMIARREWHPQVMEPLPSLLGGGRLASGRAA